MKFIKKHKKLIICLSITILFVFFIIFSIKNKEKINNFNIGKTEKQEEIEITIEEKKIDFKKYGINYLITVYAKSGIEKIIKPDGTEITPIEEKDRISIDYFERDGENFTFRAISKDGEYIEKEVNVKVQKKWNLGVSTAPGLEIYKGTPDFQGEENGVYLENAILKLNCPLESSYTLIIETKDIEIDSEPNLYAGAIVGYGYGASGVGSYFLGISKWYQTYFGAMTGSGDGYTIAKPIDTYPKGKWTTLAIKYDGKEFALYVDGVKIGTSTSSTRKGDTLYIGGFSNSGTFEGAYWGYAKGYYRNLAVYDIALTDEQIANYQF